LLGNGDRNETVMDIEEVNGRSMALLLVQESEGDIENTCVVTGTARWDGERLSVEMGAGRSPLSVPEPRLDRIRRVPPELSLELDGADWFLMLYVAPIPEDSDIRALPALAVHWPA
jgi:hypothetical protein